MMLEELLRGTAFGGRYFVRSLNHPLILVLNTSLPELHVGVHMQFQGCGGCLILV